MGIASQPGPGPTPTSDPGPPALSKSVGPPRHGKAGTKRTAWKSYSAGELSDLTFAWSSTPFTIDETLRVQLRRLRARSRQQIENNPYARRFVQSCRSNIVGPKGLTLSCQARDPNGTIDTAVNRLIEESFSEYLQTKAIDVGGRMTGIELQNLLVSTVAGDGEGLLRRWVGPKYGGKWGISFQSIDPEMLDVDHFEELRNGNIVRMGVEMDALRRPVAYWFRDTKDRPDGSLPLGGGPAGSRIRIPASEITHGYLMERTNQSRGIPWLSTVLPRLNMLNGSDEASLVAVRMGASQMGFITTPDGQTDGDAGESPEAESIEEVSPGQIKKLAEGETFNSFNPDYPRGEYPEFQKAMLRGVAAGSLVSYPVLSQDWIGPTWTSTRTALLEERDLWKVLQEWFAYAFMQRIYLEWLEVQLILGNLRLGSGALYPDRQAKYERISWRGRRWEWVDPQNEMAAAKEAIAQRLKSRSGLIRDMTQEDPEEVWTEIADEEAFLTKLGLSLPAATASTPAPADPASTEDNPPASVAAGGNANASQD